MSFFYTNSTPRSRRGKERDTHHHRTNSSSTNGRRRESHKHHDRSPPPKSPSIQSSLYAQQNLALDQVPPVPSPVPTSPETSSPVQAASQPLYASDGVYHLPYHLQTPASLQQYLESDGETKDTSLGDSMHISPTFEREAEHQDPDVALSATSRSQDAASISGDALSQGPGTSQTNPIVRADSPSLLSLTSSITSQHREHIKLSSGHQCNFSRPLDTQQSCSVPCSTTSPPPTAETLVAGISLNRDDISESNSSHMQPSPPSSPHVSLTTSNAEEPPMLRAFTPPAPPRTLGPSQSPTVFMSPVPLRARPSHDQFLAYAGAPNYPISHPGSHSLDMQHMHPSPTQYYMDYYRHNPYPFQPQMAYSSLGAHGMQPFTSNSDYKGTQKPPLTISQPDHDLNEILHHIQSSLPDLNMLISRFHEASGRFNARESFVYRTEAQQAENLRQRDMHIERLLQDIEHKTHKHSVESDRLRSIIFGLEKERKELRDKMFAASNSHELTESTEHGGSIRNEDKEHTNEDETTTPVRSPEDIVTRPRKGHVSFKNDGLKDLSLTTVESPHMKQRKLLEFHSSSEQSEPKTESEWLTERKSLEEKLTIQRDVFEKETKTLHMRIKELEKRATYAEEIHTRQPNSLAQTLNEQRDELNHHWERLFQEMTTHHQKELEENHMTWQDRYDRFATNHRKQMQDMQRAVEIVEEKHHKSCNDLEEENEKLRANTENIRATWTAERSKFLKITNELKAVAVKLNEEKQNMQMMIEAFGETIDLRSQGDSYFINAFKQLEQQIHDMAVNVCKGELTNDLPDHAMQRMPKGIPDFSSADPASIQIRCYYAESLIARILTERIFQPFLFTLHRRHEVANHLFEETSQKMRQSSPRKEAVWRQQTLHAAYTCSAATNKVAAKIVEEILYEVGPFMAVDASEQLVAAVRLIVKTAAEAWRYARLELDTITASMSPEHHPTLFDPVCRTLNGQGKGGRVLLCTLPLIQREPHTLAPSSNDTQDEGCIYSRGRVLLSGSSVIRACLAANADRNTTRRQEESEPSAEARIGKASNADRSDASPIHALTNMKRDSKGKNDGSHGQDDQDEEEIVGKPMDTSSEPPEGSFVSTTE